MDFNMGSIEAAKEAAQQADNIGGSYVEKPGAYAGKIKKAYFQKFPSGSGGLKLESEVVDKNGEKKSLNILIFTMKKDGKSTYEKDGKTYPLPGMNQITGGLMPVANKKELQSTKNAKDEITYPSLEGVEVGFLVNITLSDGKNGKVYKNAELVAFFDPKTNRTGSEILNNTEAKKKEKIEAGLKVIDNTTKKQAQSDPFADEEDDLTNDPFAQENEDAENNKEAIEEKTEIESENDFWKEDSK